MTSIYTKSKNASRTPKLFKTKWKTKCLTVKKDTKVTDFKTQSPEIIQIIQSIQSALPVNTVHLALNSISIPSGKLLANQHSHNHNIFPFDVSCHVS